MTLQFDGYADIAGDVDVLLDRLDIVLTAGILEPETRRAIRAVLQDIYDPDVRTRLALYMILISSDYAVRL